MEQLLGFERSAVRMRGGGYFQPLKESVERWCAEEPTAYAITGSNIHVLYQRGSRGFVRVLYECCLPQVVGGRRVWITDVPAEAWEVSDLEALDFLVKIQGEIPDCLQDKLPELDEIQRQLEEEQQAEPPVRPVEHWLNQHGIGRTIQVPAHEVDVIARSQEILEHVFDLVQRLRKRGAATDYYDIDTLAVEMLLFASFDVDREHWWGSTEAVPPATVDLLDLPWPPGSESIFDALGELRGLLAIPLAANAALRQGLTINYPTQVERQQNEQALLATLPTLEDLAIRLQDALAEFTPEEQPSAKPKKPLKPPTAKDVRVHLIWLATGAPQHEVAEIYKKYSRQPMTQGQVCRAIKKVVAWLEAANALPDAEPLPEVHTMDPKFIDMGANKQGRTPRQRNKRESDD